MCSKYVGPVRTFEEEETGFFFFFIARMTTLPINHLMKNILKLCFETLAPIFSTVSGNDFLKEDQNETCDVFDVF